MKRLVKILETASLIQIGVYIEQKSITGIVVCMVLSIVFALVHDDYVKKEPK